jgi:hypothetical protein
MGIQKYILNEDINMICVTAKSFPDGIIEAFQTLESFDPSICERSFYGITYQDKTGETIYKAAVAESFDGEAKIYGCETFKLIKGEYLTIAIYDFMKNIEVIPRAFQKLVADSRHDNSFPGIEWYRNDREVILMVRTKQSQKIKLKKVVVLKR